MSDVSFKAFNGQFNIDQAEGIVECFVAAIGNKDSVGDVVVSGAFTESLKRRKPRVVWGHSWNDPIGKVLEIYEVPSNDPRLPGKMKQAGVGGLYAKVQFNLATEKGREAFASVAFFGQEQEWSIGYKTIQASFDPNMQANILKEVELYEVSPVLHGANQLTSTLSVKSDEAEKGHMPMAMRMPGFGPQQEPKLVVVRLEDEDDDDGEERDLFAGGEAAPISDEQRNALEMELMSRSSEPIKIISATENSAIFVRKIGESKLVYRIAYHFDQNQREFMFGKPERLTGAAEARVSGTTVIPSQMPGMPMAVKPGMSVPMQPTQMLMQKFDSEKSLDFGDGSDDKLQTIIDMLSQLIPANEKSEPAIDKQPDEFSVFLKTEQIYEAKQLLDPVLDYHRLEWTIDDEGIHVTTPVEGETLDALRAARSNIYSHFGRGSLGKAVGASEKSGAPDHQEVKALGGKLGSRIGGGLRSAGPGMSFVDITGTVDADVDGVVFEGKPGLERPIIPRFVVPKDLARKLSKLTVGDATSIEKQRRAGNTNIQFDENRLRSLIHDLGEDPSVLARMSDDGGLPDAAKKPAMRSMSSMSDDDLQREWDANKPYQPRPGVIGMNPMLEDDKVARRREILKEMRKRGMEPEGGIPANIALGEVFERARGDFDRLKPSGKPGYSRVDGTDVLRDQAGMRSFAKPDRKIRKARQAVDRAEQFYKRENDFVVNNIADGFTHSTYDQDKPIREFTKKDRFGSDIPFKEYEGTIKSGPFKGWDYEVREEWTENEDSRVYGVRGSITSPNGTKYSIGSSGDWSGNNRKWAPFELYGIIEKPFGLRSRSGGFPLGDNRPPLGGRKQQIEIVFERPSREDQKKYDIQRQMDEVQKEIDAWTRGMGSYERRDGTVVTVRKPDEYRAEKAKEKLAKLQKRLEDTQAEIDYRDRSRKEREEQAVRPLNKQENERMEELRKKLIDPRTGRPRSKQERMREYEDYLRNYWKRRLEDEKRDISLQYSDFNGGDFEQWDESFKRQLRELRALERRDQESKLPSGSRSKPDDQDSNNRQSRSIPSWVIEPLVGGGSVRRGTSGNARSGMRSSSDWGHLTRVRDNIDWSRPEKEKNGVLEWKGSMDSTLFVAQIPTTGEWTAWEIPVEIDDDLPDHIELGRDFNLDGAIDLLRTRERVNKKTAIFNQKLKAKFDERDAALEKNQGMRSRSSDRRAVDEFLRSDPGMDSVVEERRRIDFTRPDDEFENIREWLGSSGAVLQIEDQDDGSFVARVMREGDSPDGIELVSEDIFSSEGEAKRYLNREYSSLSRRSGSMAPRTPQAGDEAVDTMSAVGGGMRSRSDSGKSKKPSRKLTPEQVRISQEQKLRSKKVPGKRKDGPTKQEWGFRSRSQSDSPRFMTGEGFNSDIPSVAAYTAARRAGGSQRGGGMRSRSGDVKTGRTEIAGEATFFKQVLDSLPKEIAAARTAGDNATAKSLGELAEIMRRQKSAEVGPKRTNAGAVYLTQAEVDSIIDALMFVLDRQTSTGGSRAPIFSQLIDLLASAAMSTFIDKATPEIHDRFVMRENSQGRMVKIPISR
jgi:HK97 family phage prohead protease